MLIIIHLHAVIIIIIIITKIIIIIIIKNNNNSNNNSNNNNNNHNNNHYNNHNNNKHNNHNDIEFYFIIKTAVPEMEILHKTLICTCFFTDEAFNMMSAKIIIPAATVHKHAAVLLMSIVGFPGMPSRVGNSLIVVGPNKPSFT